MDRRFLLLPLLIAVAFAAGRFSQADDEAPATVKAQLYRIIYAESGLDLSHGGGRWIHEIFIPEHKVAAMVVRETELKAPEPGAPAEFVHQVRLITFPSDRARNDLTGIGGTPSTIEDIEIPADLAATIVAFAKLSDRQRAESLRLGKATAEGLGLEEIKTPGHQ